jgi:hypothetical protein
VQSPDFKLPAPLKNKKKMPGNETKATKPGEQGKGKCTAVLVGSSSE